MKLKKVQDTELSAVNTTADTLMTSPLDLGGPVSASASDGVGATVACVCALLAIGLLGATAWLIYQNLNLLESA